MTRDMLGSTHVILTLTYRTRRLQRKMDDFKKISLVKFGPSRRKMLNFIEFWSIRFIFSFLVLNELVVKFMLILRRILVLKVQH